MAPRARVAVDVGGTFIDIVAIGGDGELRSAKLPSLIKRRATSVRDGATELLGDGGLRRVELFVHGTTVMTNALLERKGARVGILTTAGFRDVLEIQRENKARLYDLQYRKPEPLVPRQLRLEVKERVGADGTVVQALDEDDARIQIRRLREQGVDAVAVCLLFSFIESTHEETLGRLIAEEFPEAAVSLSSRVSPLWKEYERFSTTTANAYLQPLADQYLGELDDVLAASGLESRLLVMQSNGGVSSVADARDQPVNLAVSGPAGGVMAGMRLAELVGLDKVLTLDMGGTSTDVCLVSSDGPAMSQQRELAFGVPLRIPSIDVQTVGAGGGSIAWVDSAGALHVGPESAGADPGPACYDLGGVEATVTDANLVLGRLRPGQILGGHIRINHDRAFAAVERLAACLSLDVEQTAVGVVDIATAHLAQAIRLVSVERGYDPRDFALVAFGGAGPMHACFAAAELDIRRVLVPPRPGVTSALGMLLTDIRHEHVRTLLAPLEESCCLRLARVLSELQASGQERLSADGVPREHMEFRRFLQVRYVGQTHEITIPLTVDLDDPQTVHVIVSDAHAQHERLFGFSLLDEPLEIVGVAVTAIGRIDRPSLRDVGASDSASPEPASWREVVFADGRLPTPVYDRSRLRGGHRFAGPAVIEQMDATTVVPPGWQASVDKLGVILLTTTNGGLRLRER